MRIYVRLLDEGTLVWCPVEAFHLRDDHYRIIEVNGDPEDTRWEFETGGTVRCKPQGTESGERVFLAAYERMAENG